MDQSLELSVRRQWVKREEALGTARKLGERLGSGRTPSIDRVAQFTTGSREGVAIPALII